MGTCEKRLNPDQQRLAADNWPLVTFVIERYWRGRYDRFEDDLLSAGQLGLVKAALTYDPSRCKFSTWAVKLIHQQIIAAVRKLTNRVRTFNVDTADPDQNPLLTLQSPEPGESAGSEWAEVECGRLQRCGVATEREWAVLWSRFGEGDSIPETAEKFELEVREVVNSVQRTKTRFRKRGRVMV